MRNCNTKCGRNLFLRICDSWSTYLIKESLVMELKFLSKNEDLATETRLALNKKWWKFWAWYERNNHIKVFNLVWLWHMRTSYYIKIRIIKTWNKEELWFIYLQKIRERRVCKNYSKVRSMYTELASLFFNRIE